MKLVRFAAFAAVVACANSALATDFELVQEQGWDFPLSPGMTQLMFDQFDEMGGLRTLKEVCVEFDATISAQATAENRSTIPAPAFFLEISAAVTFDLESFSEVLLLNQSVGPVALAASDDGGVGNGMGPDFHDFGLIQSSDSYNDSVGPAGFVGVGTVTAFIEGFAGFSFSGTTDATLTTQNLMASGTVKLIYKYSEIPAPTASVALGLAGLATARRRRV